MIEMLPLVPIALIALVAAVVSSRKSGPPASVGEPLDCDTRFRAIKQSGKRPVPPRVIVLHSTEGSTAAGAAGWFTNDKAGGSAHVVVDDGACFRTLPDDVVAWGAQGVNKDGLHLEIAGFAKWTRAEWLAHPGRLAKAARIVAGWCRTYGIPARLLTVDELKSGARGIITHAIAVKAYGGDHWDPGTGFPLEQLVDQVRAELGGDGGPIA